MSPCTNLAQMRNTGTRLTNAQFPYPQFFLSDNCMISESDESVFPNISKPLDAQGYHIFSISQPFRLGDNLVFDETIGETVRRLYVDTKYAIDFTFSSFYIPTNFQMIHVIRQDNNTDRVYFHFYDGNSVVSSLSNLFVPEYYFEKFENSHKLVNKMILFRTESFFGLVNSMCISNRQIHVGTLREVPFGNTNWLSHTWRPGDRNCDEHSVAISALTQVLPEETQCIAEQQNLDAVYGQSWDVPACGFGSRGNRETSLKAQFESSESCAFSTKSIKSSTYFSKCPQEAFCSNRKGQNGVNIDCNITTIIPPYPGTEILPDIARFQQKTIEVADTTESIRIVSPFHNNGSIILIVLIFVLIVVYIITVIHFYLKRTNSIPDHTR